MFQVVLSAPAEADLAEALAGLAAYSPGAEIRWLDGVEDAIESLSEFPLRAPVIPETPATGFQYRHLFFRAHRIVFRVDEAANTVFVVRVYHSKRQPLSDDDLA